MVNWRTIQQARQLVASESGATVRDWGGRLPIVLAYPNSYAVGMSSLAMHSLYHWFNDMPGVVCERAFDSLSNHASAQDPLITLESQRPLAEAAAVAFSVSFEMDYFNLAQMLRRAHIPLLAAEREQGDPLIIMGGPAVSANPAPMAPLADAIVIGEAEELLEPLAAVLRGAGMLDRDDLLQALAQIPSIYVPAVHQSLAEQGQSIARRYLTDLDAWPTTTRIVAPQAEFGDMHLIEISRGCGRGCRFCLAGYWYRPRRERSLDLILDQAREGLRHGQKIGLVASAVSDYSRIDELVTALRGMDARISISSLRVKPLSPVLVQALADSGAQSITLAPEAGSERLRSVIRKGIAHEDVLAAASLAARHDFRSLKLYYMVGLPTETDDDIEAMVELSLQVNEIFGREVVVNVTPFVPKAHTAFQHVAVTPSAVIQARLDHIQKGVRAAGMALRSESPQSTRIQALLSRGDERVGHVLAAMPRPTPKRFERALLQADVDPEAWLAEQPLVGPFPWDMVDPQLPQALLRKEWARAEQDSQSWALECPQVPDEPS